jgi:multidrug resistance efflux pump
VAAADGKVAQSQADLSYAQHQRQIYERLEREDSTRGDDVTLWQDKMNAADAALRKAQANLEATRLNYESEIDGVNTSVANVAAQLKEAQYYLDNTTLSAPEDGLKYRNGLLIARSYHGQRRGER